MTKRTKVTTITLSSIGIVAVIMIFIYFLIGGFFFSLSLDPNNDILMSSGASDNVMPPAPEEGEPSFDDHDEWFDGIGSTRVTYTSNDKLKLNLSAIKIMNATPTNNWAIITHGYRGNAVSMKYYSYFFYQMGFNVLMPDLRGHGESEGNYIGMGWHDSDDILTLINTQILPAYPDANIALLGVSMGAATTMMATGLDLPSNVKVAVSDCGYSNVYEQFTFVLKNFMNLPREPIMSSASIITSYKANYSLKEADTLTRLKQSKTPTLFIHGDQDDFVPYYMLEKNYNACAAPDKLMVTVEGAVHANAAIKGGDSYWNYIRSFMAKYIVLTAQ